MEENNKRNVDFNCDLAQVASVDETDKALELVDYMSSVNVSCGFHSGCPVSIKRAIEYCKFKNKVIGAHIGLPSTVSDALTLSEEEVEAVVLYQLGAISSFAKAYSLNIEHVRPHGEMYKLAALDAEFSAKIAKAVKKFSKWFVYYGAAGENLKETGASVGINIAQELHLNKAYNAEGQIDFSKENLADTGKSLIRLRRLMNLSEIETENQVFKKVEFDTIHFSTLADNVLDLAKEANNIVVPRPVNFNKVVTSGWVE